MEAIVRGESGPVPVWRNPRSSPTIVRNDDNRAIDMTDHASLLNTAIGIDEDRLADAFAARDQTAFAEVYKRYAPTFYGVAARVVGVKQDAEDCVHDTLLSIWSKPNTYCKARGALRSFLLVAVRNEALSRRRVATRHAKIELRLQTPIRIEDFSAGLRDHVECGNLRAALKELAPDLREPIIRAYMHYQTHEQISRELGIPLGTIKSRLLRGLRKLHGELAIENSVRDGSHRRKR